MNRRNTPSLPSLRKRIDQLDRRLLQLLNRRATRALAIGRLKHRRKWPVFDAAREASVLRQILQANGGPLSAAAVRHIFQAILCECRRRQRSRPQPAAGGRKRTQ